ncbi:MAG: rod shape-determining protein MreC [Paludibacteraceae bacterium]|nr:rod shape-determining protein MreC [Paludibacteraceae bacterium]
MIQFLVRYSNFLIFLILEVVAFILIGTCNDYQQSAIWSSANRIAAGTNNIKTSIVDYFSLRADNAELAEENARLKAELMLLTNNVEILSERDSQYVYSHLDWDYMPAKVIGLTTNKQHNYLTINKGKRDSIEVDMGVISADGVVGVVSAVGEKYALVVPIIHTKISISSRLKSNGQIGGTSWDGRNYRFVDLIEIARHVSVNKGDTIVTSGLTDVFPEGLMVGVVSETELGAGDNYHQTVVELSTDYKALKYVQVLRNNNTKMTDKIGKNHGME